ncbi:MAG TPA: dockerin type I domain-containing protein [Pseudobacteroides sp.]|uniref:dockerin type I domain-containing protein n=1 Tax=Pseudobacteroides sp. TaxID=1968840 RepID=UPI002F922349
MKRVLAYLMIFVFIVALQPMNSICSEVQEDYKIYGYLCTDHKLTNSVMNSGFRVYLPSCNIEAYTDSSGYFEITGKFIPGADTNIYVTKEQYLTRYISISPVKNMMIGSPQVPFEMCAGDVNNDNAVNMSDIVILASSFNTLKGDDKYSYKGDLNWDSAINMSDVVIIAKNFNKTSESYITPMKSEITDIKMKVGEVFAVTKREGGSGIKWNAEISDDTVVVLDKSTIENTEPAGAPYTHTWEFKALSLGNVIVTFHSNYVGGMPDIYNIKVEGNPQNSTPIQSSSTPTKPSDTPSPSASPIPSAVDHSMLTPYSDCNIVPGQNTIFCPTFQMAWDGLKKDAGGDVVLEGKPPLADILNKGFDWSNSLTEDSYVAISGIGDNMVEQIKNNLKSKFGDDAPEVESIGPGGYISCAFLLKKMKFAKSFEDTRPIFFSSNGETTQVASFGIENGSKRYNDLSSQVSIYDYKNDNDFIVKLLPEDTNEEIILAKVAPGETLNKTYAEIMERIKKSTPESLRFTESIAIPEVNLNIEGEYSDLHKRIFNQALYDYKITKAYQNVKFKLNKDGVKLASEAIILATPSAIMNKKNLVFDKQFLICLKQKDAQNPYLLIWIDNPGVLVNK